MEERMKHTRVISVLIMTLALMSAALLGAGQAQAAGPDLRCRMSFSLSGWSAIYQRAEGKGVVKCADGSVLHVLIAARGGGLTAGKWQVDDGVGTFSDVHRPSDVLGRYAEGGAQAGIVKSAAAQVLTKGTVSLALAGRGEGIDLGVAFGEVTLSPAK
jgi:hypothetical protein